MPCVAILCSRSSELEPKRRPQLGRLHLNECAIDTSASCADSELLTGLAESSFRRSRTATRRNLTCFSASLIFWNWQLLLNLEFWAASSAFNLYWTCCFYSQMSASVYCLLSVKNSCCQFNYADHWRYSNYFVGSEIGEKSFVGADYGSGSGTRWIPSEQKQQTANASMCGRDVWKWPIPILGNDACNTGGKKIFIEQKTISKLLRFSLDMVMTLLLYWMKMYGHYINEVAQLYCRIQFPLSISGNAQSWNTTVPESGRPSDIVLPSWIFIQKRPIYHPLKLVFKKPK